MTKSLGRSRTPPSSKLIPSSLCAGPCDALGWNSDITVFFCITCPQFQERPCSSKECWCVLLAFVFAHLYRNLYGILYLIHLFSVFSTLAACDQCDAVFAFRDGLVRHVRLVHEGVRNFRCTVPGCRSDAFKQAAHLKKVRFFELFLCPLCSRVTLR